MTYNLLKDGLSVHSACVGVMNHAVKLEDFSMMNTFTAQSVQ